MRFITNTIFERDGKYFVMVDVPSNEEPDIENPTKFGTTEDAGPFDSLDEQLVAVFLPPCLWPFERGCNENY